MSQLSRQEMIERIEGGESVSFQGRILRTVEDVPPEEDIAVSVEEKQKVRQQLIRQRDELDRRISTLDDEITHGERDRAERERERKEAAKRGEQTHQQAGTGQPVGAPLNPNTSFPYAPGQQPVATPGGQTQGQHKVGGQQGQQQTDDDPVFAGRKLSVYRKKLTDKNVPAAEREKYLDENFEGVGEKTAQEIVKALDGGTSQK